MTAERCWQAVVARDSGARFVYAVRTTGVYCRPGCPSRRPRREVVSFFASPAAAEAAGYRPCRRCRPEGPPETRRLMEVWSALAASGRPVTLARLGRALGMPPHRARRAFCRAFGCSPRELFDGLRLDRLRRRLQEGTSVTEALYDAGFGSASRLYERAADRLGMTPGAYRRGGSGERVRYACARCSLGWLLVAATERGICAVRLGASERELEASLAREFLRAERRRDDRGLARWVEAAVRLADGRPPAADLPLDLRGTAFQVRVWKAIAAIPRGQTRTYREIARDVGRPRAVRAVAQACAANPVSLVVPCHRVIRSDGGLGGYRWGLARKRALLERERT
ncbi:MAG TPA: bifunctional DNA-binding transcriptional regulator/O6-methylguanine-DNA methyltransferase Ada [Vicinamibacterales bacterium]|nr:bifunctional DNA-binding transcriptional regulator/O6-methylguanine-DNA methyltransferase Ada [Vicinamibacterales bacterium]